MNVEIGAEAALFPEKEYISGISVAVWTVPTALAVRTVVCPKQELLSCELLAFPAVVI
jgi:hypothetical protein